MISLAKVFWGDSAGSVALRWLVRLLVLAACWATGEARGAEVKVTAWSLLRAYGDVQMGLRIPDRLREECVPTDDNKDWMCFGTLRYGEAKIPVAESVFTGEDGKVHGMRVQTVGASNCARLRSWADAMRTAVRSHGGELADPPAEEGKTHLIWLFGPHGFGYDKVPITAANLPMAVLGQPVAPTVGQPLCSLIYINTAMRD
jgi:hypothetical protein